MMRNRTALLLIATCLLAGCVPSPDGLPYMRLIDRRSFAPQGEAASGTPLVLPHRALATVNFNTPAMPDYTALDAAVDAAQARKSDAEFDVVAPLRPNAEPEQAMQRHAIEVAHEIAERGVSPERIHIGIAQDQGAPPRELRIYVR